MNAKKYIAILSVAAIATFYGLPQAEATLILSSDLAKFSVLGATPSVTNTGATTLTGDVGVSPAGSITGLNTITVNGTNGANTPNPNVHLADATATQAQADLVTAIGSLSSLGPGTLLPADITGLTLLPGVYTVPAGTTNLSGMVTLDGQGNANAFWLFQATSSLITSSGSLVNLIDTGSGAGVFWNVGSSATLNSSSTFEGNILALTSITLGSAVTINCGRALASTGTVTMIGDTINAGDCTGTGADNSNGLGGSGLDYVSNKGGAGTVVDIATGHVVSVPGTIPEPATLALFVIGFVGLGFTRRRYG